MTLKYFFRYIYAVWNVLGVPRYVCYIEVSMFFGTFNFPVWKPIAVIHCKKKNLGKFLIDLIYHFIRV